MRRSMLALVSRALKGREAFVIALAFCGLGCGGGDPAIAQRNLVFYAYEVSGDHLQHEYERPYPPLDLKSQGTDPDFLGVEVLEGKVRISRPANWVIRSASNQPGRRFIQYLSPNEYVFSIYERQELPNALWSDVQARYEQDLRDVKAEIVHKGVPIATFNAQGRAYLIKRKVLAAKNPFVNLSKEYLARADHRVVLVQVVHSPDGLSPVSQELLRAIRTMELR